MDGPDDGCSTMATTLPPTPAASNAALAHPFRAPAAIAHGAPRAMPAATREFLLETAYANVATGLLIGALGLVLCAGFVVNAIQVGALNIGALPAFLLVLAGGLSLRTGIRARRHTLHAYQEGEVVNGRIVERSPMAFRRNQAHRRLRWAFEIQGVRYEGTLLHRDLHRVARVLPDDEVSVLYVPGDPSVNTLWLDASAR